MKLRYQLAAILFIVSILAANLNAQETRTRSWSSASEGGGINVEGDIFQLPELGAAIASDGKKVTFLMVMDGDQRPKGYRDVDAKSGDEILMMNAKRVKDTATMKEIYEGLAIGDDVKIGVKRDGKMFIVNFPKIDPENAPRMVMHVSTGDGPGVEGEGHNMMPLVGLHIILKDGMELEKLDGLPGETPEDADLQTGDVVTAINGQTVSAIADFRKIYEAVKPGEEMKIAVTRDGKSVISTFNKPETQGRVMIRGN